MRVLPFLGVILAWCTYPILVLETVFNKNEGEIVAMPIQVNIWLALAGSVLGAYTASMYMYAKFSVHDMVFSSLAVFSIHQLVIATITLELHLLLDPLLAALLLCARPKLRESSTLMELLIQMELFFIFYSHLFSQLSFQLFWLGLTNHLFRQL